MKLPMNTDIYSIGFVSETIWRRIVSGATGTRATIIKWPLGGLSNLFIFISDIAVGNVRGQIASKFFKGLYLKKSLWVTYVSATIFLKLTGMYEWFDLTMFPVQAARLRSSSKAVFIISNQMVGQLIIGFAWMH